MNFLALGSLWFALVLPAIVLLYLLKLRRQEVVVSSLLLWRKSLHDMQANVPFQRLRNNLLLWLQLAVATLLVIALLRPVLHMRAQRGRFSVLLIDHSASMNASDVAPSRLAFAKKAALRLIDRMRAGDSMMIVAFAARARVQATRTDDKRALAKAVRSIEPTDLPTRAAEAIELALAATRDIADARVLLLSDGQIEDLDSIKNLPPNFTFVPIGRKADNVAITNFDARTELAANGSISAQIFVRVERFGETPEDVVVELTRGQTILDAKSVCLSPGGAAELTLVAPSIEPGLVSVSVDARDALRTDDRVWCFLRPPRRTRVLLVSKGNFFLEKALVLQPQLEVAQTEPKDFSSAADYDVVVFDRWAPAKLERGCYLFFGAAPNVEGIHTENTVKGPTVLDWDRSHPIARFIDFAGLNIAEARRIETSPDVVPLVESRDGPLVVLVDREALRAVVVAFDVLKSDWPARVSFPLFVANAIDWLRRGAKASAPGMIRVGQPFPLRGFEEGVSYAEIVATNGRSFRVALASDRTVYFANTDRVGIYSVRPARGAPFSFGVNLLSERESNILPRRSLPLLGRTFAGTTAPLQTDREVWRYFVLAAVGLLFVEWYVYTKRAWL